MINTLPLFGFDLFAMRRTVLPETTQTAPGKTKTSDPLPEDAADQFDRDHSFQAFHWGMYPVY